VKAFGCIRRSKNLNKTKIRKKVLMIIFKKYCKNLGFGEGISAQIFGKNWQIFSI